MSDSLKLWHDYKDKVNATPELKELRDWVEEHKHGYGDRPLYWMWHEIIKEVPPFATCLEIGVFKGQTLAIWGQLSRLLSKPLKIYGVTPLESTMDSYTVHPEDDYKARIDEIHDAFKLPHPHIITGLSQEVVNLTPRPLDVLFIDGSHDEEDVRKDIELYTPRVARRGFVIFDDANCYLGLKTDDEMWYTGLEQVSLVVDEFERHNPSFENVGIVGHNRVFRRK